MQLSSLTSFQLDGIKTITREFRAENVSAERITEMIKATGYEAEPDTISPVKKEVADKLSLVRKSGPDICHVEFPYCGRSIRAHEKSINSLEKELAKWNEILKNNDQKMLQHLVPTYLTKMLSSYEKDIEKDFQNIFPDPNVRAVILEKMAGLDHSKITELKTILSKGKAEKSSPLKAVFSQINHEWENGTLFKLLGKKAKILSALFAILVVGIPALDANYGFFEKIIAGTKKLLQEAPTGSSSTTEPQYFSAQVQFGNGKC